MPDLPVASHKTDTIGIGIGGSGTGGDGDETMFHAGGKWEDEEERRFYEDVQDLKDFVPKAVLGLEEGGKSDEVETANTKDAKEKEEEQEREKLDEEMRKMEAELEGLTVNGNVPHADVPSATTGIDEEEEYVHDTEVIDTLLTFWTVVPPHQLLARRRRPRQRRHLSLLPKARPSC
jgi:regulator of nonsense transcripts 2